MRTRRKEEGAVLIVALLFLVLLTMLGVTAMTGTSMEQRMASNTRDVGIALQAAESALRDARRDINGLVVNTGVARNPTMHISHFGDGTGQNNGSCSASPQQQGLCRPRDYAATVDAVLDSEPTVNWNAAAPSVKYGSFTGAQEIKGVAREPRYIIEIFCLPQHGASIGSAPCKFYRITARGWGGNPNTQVTLQEVFLSL
ncbi:MAG: pilus assembly PilX family protein [Burkholderiales bacterium]